MADHTRTLPAEVSALLHGGALFVANHSGGKDSQAMLIELLKVVPRDQLIVGHAALGEIEWEGALEHAEKQATAAGVPFIIARAVKSFFEMVEHRFAARPDAPCWPSAAIRQCTSDLKRGPIEREVHRYARAHGYTKIVNCTGIRAEESPARSKRPVFARNPRGSTARREWYDWLPIHEFSTSEVFETIRAAGERPHWAYEAGNARLSCVFCILANPRDLANGARHRPELYAKYLEIEQRTGYTMHQSRRPLAELVHAGDASSGAYEQAVKSAPACRGKSSGASGRSASDAR